MLTPPNPRPPPHSAPALLLFFVSILRDNIGLGAPPGDKFGERGPLRFADSCENGITKHPVESAQEPRACVLSLAYNLTPHVVLSDEFSVLI